MTTTTPPGAAGWGEGEPRERIRVWDLVVRVTHWTIAFSILGLSITGIYIGHPYIVVAGQARDHFVMGTMKVVHFYFAIAFTLAALTRIVWMFVGKRHARWFNLIPTTRERFKEMRETAAFYLFFRNHPPHCPGHNPLAGAAYVFVFGLYLVMIATGLGLYAGEAHAEYMRSFHFLLTLSGGPQMARYIHHIVMWLLIGFFVHHLYSVILMAVKDQNGMIDSIITGDKWMVRSRVEKDCALEAKFAAKRDRS